MISTISIKLMPTKEQLKQIKATMDDYISLVNNIVNVYVSNSENLKYTSKDVIANLPSTLKCEAIHAASSVFRTYIRKYNKAIKKNSEKEIKVPVLKKKIATWNNQNYKIKEQSISFPVMINNKCTRINVQAVIPMERKKLLAGKKGTLRIIKKSGKLMAQIAVERVEKECLGSNIVGVDLGLKIPAVAATNTGKVKFLGNGRENKFLKRKHRKIRKKLGKAKKLKAIKKRHNKEKRWIKDKDHKISRKIVNFAIQSNASVIRMEQLTNIRNTARTSRKNEKNLHNWSFYRLAQYIEYKSKLLGIKVDYVNPRNTSKKCPNCEKLNTAKDRKYVCSCGYHGHRDIVGAKNIISAPVIAGKRLSA